jgi:hypothetical protein
VHGKKLQVDCAAVAVVVADVGDTWADYCLDAELFIELSREGLLGAFSGFDFSAWKLPLKGHGLVWTPLADEHFACAQDESGSHKAEGRA